MMQMSRSDQAGQQEHGQEGGPEQAPPQSTVDDEQARTSEIAVTSSEMHKQAIEAHTRPSARLTADNIGEGESAERWASKVETNQPPWENITGRWHSAQRLPPPQIVARKFQKTFGGVSL